MATAPTHLKMKEMTPEKNSDDKLLEDFFGSEELTKLDIFKKQTSVDNLHANKKTAGGMFPGISMPNISTTPSNHSSHSYTNQGQGQVKLRLKTNASDANRMSYDVCSEMEKLRMRLQETTLHELAEFDRKYSPKFYHTGILGGLNMKDGNHSRQGSLDSSIPAQPTEPPPQLKSIAGGHGHTRQHSLPVDPNYFRKLQQQNRSNENLSPYGGAGGASHSGSSLTGKASNDQSPTIPYFGHVRQISGGSMSSESGTFSPPLTPSTIQLIEYNASPSLGKGSSHGHTKPSKPPGMARYPSSDSPVSSVNKTNSRPSSASTRPPPPEGNGRTDTSRVRSSSTAQPHYSTYALKRNKKGSFDQKNSLQSVQQQQQQQVGIGRGGVRKYGGYEDKQWSANGKPSGTYHHDPSSRRSFGEDVTDDAARNAPISHGITRYTKFSPPRMEGALPASPKMTRVADKRANILTSSDSHQANPHSKLLVTKVSDHSNSIGRNGPSVHPDDIRPYMTSSHVKSQMQGVNFAYTPFTNQQKPKSTISGRGDAPKLTKKPNYEQTWI